MNVFRRPRPFARRRAGDGEDPLVFAGSGSPRLTEAICGELGVESGRFSYAKGDKKDEPRVSIRARVCADAIEAAGADRVVTLDLHAPQIQGFFRIPVDDLYAEPYLCTAIRRLALPNPVVVSPDAGFAKRARRFARRLGAPLAIADKVREDHSETPASVEMERLDASPISRLIVTDSIETQPVAFSPKVDVVSVAPLFAEAIRRIHRRESISVLFQD